MVHFPNLKTVLISFMQIIRNINTMYQLSMQHKRNGQMVALVPTMGNLHAGHLSLIKIAQQYADIVITSIFVNPSQFGPNEDYHNYPRTLATDQKLLEQCNVDYIFSPEAKDIYIEEKINTRIHVHNLEELLCGISRPQHFSGVATIVSILFTITAPDIAVFGEKDYQQLLVIKQLVRDLHYNIKILSGPIIRENSGIALSSRNHYLTKEQKSIAPLLFQTLKEIVQEIKNIIQHKKKDILFNTVLEAYKTKLNNHGFTIDYLELCDSNDLSKILSMQAINKYPENNIQVILLVAAYIGKTRLIDNIKFF